MHELQDEGTAVVETVQTFRARVCVFDEGLHIGNAKSRTVVTRRRRVQPWCSRRGSLCFVGVALLRNLAIWLF